MPKTGAEIEHLMCLVLYIVQPDMTEIINLCHLEHSGLKISNVVIRGLI